jgi:hypothetical protein
MHGILSLLGFSKKGCETESEADRVPGVFVTLHLNNAAFAGNRMFKSSTIFESDRYELVAGTSLISLLQLFGALGRH